MPLYIAITIELISGEKSNIALTANTSDALMFKLNVNNEKSIKFIVTIKNKQATSCSLIHLLM